MQRSCLKSLALDMQIVTEGQRPSTFRSFLDSMQYSTNSILRYERIFGSGFVSTGGLDTTKVSVRHLCLCKQPRVSAAGESA